MAFNLKKFRTEKLNITQEELARVLGVSQDRISRLESKDSIDVDFLMKLSEYSGLSPNKILEYKTPFFSRIFKIKNKWTDSENLRESLSKSIDEIKEIENEDSKYLKISSFKKECKSILNVNLRKPVIAFMGQVDTGKSSLINSLIGSDKLPVNLNAVTSCFVYVKHIDDKPDFIKDEVVVFRDKDEQGNEFSISTFTDITLSKKEQKDNFNRFLIKSGDCSLLDEYATKEHNHEEVGFCVIYVNSEILTNVDFVDCPGFDRHENQYNNDKNWQHTINLRNDAIVYVSKTLDFINAYDIELLSIILSKVNVDKVGNNLFIVASQARNLKFLKSDKSFDQLLNEKIEEGIKNLVSGITYGKNDKAKEEVLHNALKERFFAYSIEEDESENDIQIPLRSNLESFIEKLYLKFKNNTKDNLLDLISTTYEFYDNKKNLYESLLNKNRDKASYEMELYKLKMQFDVFKTLAKHSLEHCYKSSLSDFENSYRLIVNENSFINLIKMWGIKKRKSDMELFCNKLSAKLYSELDQILSKKWEEFIGELKDSFKDFYEIYNSFIKNYPTLESYSGDKNWSVDFSYLLQSINFSNNDEKNFNSKNESIYSSKNNEAILNTVKGAAIIGSFLFSPIVFVGFTMLSSLTCLGMLSGGWQKDMSKKLIAEYEDKDILGLYEKDGIKYFWDKAEESLKDAIENKMYNVVFSHYPDSGSDYLKSFSKDNISYIETFNKELNSFKDKINNTL